MLMKPLYCCFKCMTIPDDDGKSARTCAAPVLWAVEQSRDELGTGRHMMEAPKQGIAMPKTVADETNQDAVLKYADSRIVVATS